MRQRAISDFDVFYQKIAPLVLALGLTALFFAWQRTPDPIPLTLVDGTYENSCCDSIAVEAGVLYTGREQTRFSLDRDNLGLFALPDKALSVSDDGQVTIGGRAPTKLRFDHSGRPSAFEITDPAGHTVYIFSRR